MEREPVRLDIECGILDLCHWPGLDGKNPGASLKVFTKDTYRLGKNDVLPRTVPPQKSGYTSSEAPHETSFEPCNHDTSSTGPLRRTPCMERFPICTPGRASTRPCWTSSFAGSKNTCPP